MRLLALAIVLTTCGGVGSDPCAAIAQLEALDERFRTGDIGAALADRDVAELSAALGSAGDEAAELRDELEASDADPLLGEAAGLFARGANLLDATFSADTIRQRDLDASFDYLDDARAKLRAAKSDADCSQ
jgi:hypothetical protein